MEEQEQFASRVRAALDRYGVSVDEVDIAVIGAVENAYGPGTDALLAADLSNIELEHDFDPGRAPSAQEQSP